MLKTLVISYVVLVAFFFVVSDFVMFQPPRSKASLNTPGTIVLHSASGKKIAALYLPSKNAKYTILFSHGNAEDLDSIRPLLDKFQSQGYSVFAYDYQGYGASEGRPNETNTYQAINAAYDYLINTLKTPSKHIILYGRSIGSGPTIDLAARLPVQGVILESPFVSAYRTVTQAPIFLFDKFKNLSKVGKIKAPVLVLQGTKDEVIPSWQGRKIYSEIKSPKTAYWIEGAHHNDIYEVAGEAYWNTLKQFTDSLDSHHER